MKLIIFLFLINLNVFAQTAGFSNDLVHFGKPASGLNSEVEIGDTGSFRYNFSTSKMQVTHDGTNYFDVPTTPPDHTLDSSGILKNKTLDDTNVINSSLFGSVVMELTSDVTQGLLDRASLIDFHASGGVDYNARIIRNQGINGSLQFQNTGTGSTSFYDNNTDQVMYYNAKGALHIAPQNSTLLGGALIIDHPPSTAFSLFFDVSDYGFGSSIARTHNGVTIFTEMDLNSGTISFRKPFTLGPTAVGGNVPHGCTTRQASANDSFGSVLVTCAAGEIATGGGCRWLAADPTWGVPNPQTGTSTGWFCEQQTGSVTRTAYAICCAY